MLSLLCQRARSAKKHVPLLQTHGQRDGRAALELCELHNVDRVIDSSYGEGFQEIVKRSEVSLSGDFDRHHTALVSTAGHDMDGLHGLLRLMVRARAGYGVRCAGNSDAGAELAPAVHLAEVLQFESRLVAFLENHFFVAVTFADFHAGLDAESTPNRILPRPLHLGKLVAIPRPADRTSFEGKELLARHLDSYGASVPSAHVGMELGEVFETTPAQNLLYFLKRIEEQPRTDAFLAHNEVQGEVVGLIDIGEHAHENSVRRAA
jgi:hypothetical protein